mmetsp:Transcript_19560/g.42777  ORF Transcript_19560/g.42777 Transcript_19560/m.42777 type:complete len:385 (+) Transcript_19560:66-1220(+)
MLDHDALVARILGICWKTSPGPGGEDKGEPFAPPVAPFVAELEVRECIEDLLKLYETDLQRRYRQEQEAQREHQQRLDGIQKQRIAILQKAARSSRADEERAQDLEVLEFRLQERSVAQDAAERQLEKTREQLKALDQELQLKEQRLSEQEAALEAEERGMVALRSSLEQREAAVAEREKSQREALQRVKCRAAELDRQEAEDRQAAEDRCLTMERRAAEVLRQRQELEAREATLAKMEALFEQRVGPQCQLEVVVPEMAKPVPDFDLISRSSISSLAPGMARSSTTGASFRRRLTARKHISAAELVVAGQKRGRCSGPGAIACDEAAGAAGSATVDDLSMVAVQDSLHERSPKAQVVESSWGLARFARPIAQPLASALGFLGR